MAWLCHTGFEDGPAIKGSTSHWHAVGDAHSAQEGVRHIALLTLLHPSSFRRSFYFLDARLVVASLEVPWSSLPTYSNLLFNLLSPSLKLLLSFLYRASRILQAPLEEPSSFR